jgi:hypothetical protein
MASMAIIVSLFVQKKECFFSGEVKCGKIGANDIRLRAERKCLNSLKQFNSAFLDEFSRIPKRVHGSVISDKKRYWKCRGH